MMHDRFGDAPTKLSQAALHAPNRRLRTSPLQREGGVGFVHAAQGGNHAKRIAKRKPHRVANGAHNPRRNNDQNEHERHFASQFPG